MTEKKEQKSSMHLMWSKVHELDFQVDLSKPKLDF